MRKEGSSNARMGLRLNDWSWIGAGAGTGAGVILMGILGGVVG